MAARAKPERALNCAKGFKSGGGRRAEVGGGRAAAEALIKSGAAGGQGSHSRGLTKGGSVEQNRVGGEKGEEDPGGAPRAGGTAQRPGRQAPG